MHLRTALRAGAVSVTAAALLAAPATADASSWHRRYYENHFRTVWTCISRGEAVIGNREASQVIPGALSYVCYQAPRQHRYSMDILFSDWADGGGGGGSRSWAVRGRVTA